MLEIKQRYCATAERAMSASRWPDCSPSKSCCWSLICSILTRFSTPACGVITSSWSTSSACCFRPRLASLKRDTQLRVVTLVLGLLPIASPKCWAAKPGAKSLGIMSPCRRKRTQPYYHSAALNAFSLVFKSQPAEFLKAH